MTYRYFELGKNADPEREDSVQFKNAFTVHPISEPNLMYRLHKRFSQIELEWTHRQIQQLQVCHAFTFTSLFCDSYLIAVSVFSNDGF